MPLTRHCLFVSALLLTPQAAPAQRQMEALDRSLVAIQQTTNTFLSWRLLASDPESVSFFGEGEGEG